ncbi:MAG: UDP-N-acetylmuramoyl-L-alanyl-D-glutamate--2,6-diaminopimelate ligase, partial [Odoribacter sp.]|nr:UDP-N-acetylmuramoyl-L-alanyl-D-glutamate--2,6-diaminopimelate ligase [Odoribacter sp.]
FDGLKKEAFALTNADDKNGAVMLQNTAARRFTYSCRTLADFNAKVIEKHLDGTLLLLDGKEVWTKFTGDFNAYNLLSVYASACLLGLEKEEVLRCMSVLVPVSGRFETILSKEGVVAVVDYAHTPDAVENVLSTIKGLKGKGNIVITVVGAGGDRDKTKRPEMADAACRYSDRVILTSDNPRNEEPEAILADMQAGVKEEYKAKVLSITDRREAIRTALMLASKGDIVLIAGKGHENYQEIKGVKHHFDDKEVVNEVFNM